MIASLALGIGATSALFSVANSLLLRDLPVQEPERLEQIDPSSRGDALVLQVVATNVDNYALQKSLGDGQG